MIRQTSTISTSTAVLSMASLCRRNLRKTSLPWLRGWGRASAGRVPSAARTESSLASSEFKSANANPRVQDAVHQISDQVGQHHRGGDDDQPAHHHIRFVLRNSPD